MTTSNFSKVVKGKLYATIEALEQRKERFIREPGKDFSRKRKISFQEVIKLILAKGSGSIDKELLEFFDYDMETITSSGFVQNRVKILPTVFSTLLKEFTHSFEDYKTFKGYRVVAVDGSDLHVPHDPTDKETYFRSREDRKGHNAIHVNALYDLINRVFLDGSIQPGKKTHETKALNQMVDNSPLEKDVLLIADRGYECYNTFAHLMEKGWKFLIRVKDTDSKSMLSTFGLPKTEEFDTSVHRIITRKRTNAVREQPTLYKPLPQNKTFDYLNKDQLFYPMSFRAVRVKLDDGSFQCFITNLDEDQFSMEEIKVLYHMRWGIETSFRELKHTLALTHLHSKKTESIVQEIFAKMTMYNFCSIITSHVAINQKSRKYDYQVNFSKAISICKRFLTGNNASINVEGLIQKYILPIRQGRSSPRKVKSRTFVSFNYRVA